MLRMESLDDRFELVDAVRSWVVFFAADNVTGLRDQLATYQYVAEHALCEALRTRRVNNRERALEIAEDVALETLEDLLRQRIAEQERAMVNDDDTYALLAWAGA